MSEKKHKNSFKFILKLENEVIIERIFNADVFNPVIRYSVDIRKQIFSIIKKLQRILSSKNLVYNESFNNNTYYYLKYYKSISNNNEKFSSALKKPPITTQEINGKILEGVEFKFGLYINKNLIVERIFLVDGYNPASRFSVELVSVVKEICNDIYYSLIEQDKNYMWDDYLLINTYGIYVNQIRELSKVERYNLLNNFKDKMFVKERRSYFKNLQRINNNLN